jgi:hypothetical protein
MGPLLATGGGIGRSPCGEIDLHRMVRILSLFRLPLSDGGASCLHGN